MAGEDEDDDDDIGQERLRRQRRRNLQKSEKVNVPDRADAPQVPAFSAGMAEGMPEQVQVLLALRASRLRRFLVRIGIFIGSSEPMENCNFHGNLIRATLLDHDITYAQVLAQVAACTEARQWGVFGEPRVNVLDLNLALDKVGK